MVHNPLPVSRGEANWGGLEWNMILPSSTERGEKREREAEGKVDLQDEREIENEGKDR
jgi:hypothetical protein